MEQTGYSVDIQGLVVVVPMVEFGGGIILVVVSS